MKWHHANEIPKKMRPFVELYHDGSCTTMLILPSGKIVNQGGDIEGALDDGMEGMSGIWCYLPPGYPFLMYVDLKDLDSKETEEAA